MSRKTIYTVTTLRGWDIGTPRVIGWYETYEEAERSVLFNDLDIHEGSETYAVIEELRPGPYPCPPTSTHWFEWNEDKREYMKLSATPKAFKSICNFGIG